MNKFVIGLFIILYSFSGSGLEKAPAKIHEPSQIFSTPLQADQLEHPSLFMSSRNGVTLNIDFQENSASLTTFVSPCPANKADFSCTAQPITREIIKLPIVEADEDQCGIRIFHGELVGGRPEFLDTLEIVDNRGFTPGKNCPEEPPEYGTEVTFRSTNNRTQKTKTSTLIGQSLQASN